MCVVHKLCTQAKRLARYAAGNVSKSFADKIRSSACGHPGKTEVREESLYVLSHHALWSIDIKRDYTVWHRWTLVGSHITTTSWPASWPSGPLGRGTPVKFTCWLNMAILAIY